MIRWLTVRARYAVRAWQAVRVWATHPELGDRVEVAF